MDEGDKGQLMTMVLNTFLLEQNQIEAGWETTDCQDYNGHTSQYIMSHG